MYLLSRWYTKKVSSSSSCPQICFPNISISTGIGIALGRFICWPVNIQCVWQRKSSFCLGGFKTVSAVSLWGPEFSATCKEHSASLRGDGKQLDSSHDPTTHPWISKVVLYRGALISPNIVLYTADGICCIIYRVPSPYSLDCCLCRCFIFQSRGSLPDFLTCRWLLPDFVSESTMESKSSY